MERKVYGLEFRLKNNSTAEEKKRNPLSLHRSKMMHQQQYAGIGISTFSIIVVWHVTLWGYHENMSRTLPWLYLFLSFFAFLFLCISLFFFLSHFIESSYYVSLYLFLYLSDFSVYLFIYLFFYYLYRYLSFSLSLSFYLSLSFSLFLSL